MTQIADQINQFHNFALARIRSANNELTIDELYDEWRIQNPEPQQAANDSLAVAASLKDYQLGVAGKPAAQVLKNLKSKLGNQ